MKAVRSLELLDKCSKSEDTTGERKCLYPKRYPVRFASKPHNCTKRTKATRTHGCRFLFGGPGSQAPKHQAENRLRASTYLPTQKPPVHIYIPRPSLRPHRTAPHRTTRRLPPNPDVSLPIETYPRTRAPRKRSGHASSITVSVPHLPPGFFPLPADDRNPPASCGARTRRPSSGGRCGGVYFWRR